MHSYKRTIAALLVAGALVSQTPAIARADDDTSCYISRNMNGARWSSNDCNEMSPKMKQDMETVHSMLARLFQPVQSENAGPKQHQSSDEKSNVDSGQNQSQGQGEGQNQGQSQDPSQDQDQNGSQNPASSKSKPQLSDQTMDAIAAFIRHLFDRLWFWS
jgi:hypothetical protein